MKFVSHLLLLSLLAPGIPPLAAAVEVDITKTDGTTMTNLRIIDLLGDHVLVRNDDVETRVLIADIATLREEKPSNVILGLGVGLVAGTIAGYYTGKAVTDDSDNRFRYTAAGAGVGALVGLSIGFFIDSDVEYDFSVLPYNEKRRLLASFVETNPK